MPEKDPAHWLYRLTPSEWLAAADNELLASRTSFAQKAQRSAVAHARRAAGMAWNAVLVNAPDDRYGRSYMDHVVALAQLADGDSSIPAAVGEAARRLRDAPSAPPQLIAIGKPDMSALDAARN